MSATVYAGASQMVGIELFGHNVQPWLIVLSVFAVNFRHILYSAAIARHIRHFSAAAEILHLLPAGRSTIRRNRETGRSAASRSPLPGISASALIIYLPWQMMTLLGAIFGQMIGDPRAIGLDVLLPIYFMGLVLGFRKRDNWLPVVAVSSLASVAAYAFRRFALACQHRRHRRHPARRLPAAAGTAAKNRPRWSRRPERWTPQNTCI